MGTAFSGEAGPQVVTEHWFRMDNHGLPPRLDLRRLACFPYPTPTDQGEEGSCVVHAASAAYLCAQRRNDVTVVRTKVPVVENLFAFARAGASQHRPGTKGVTFSEAMRSLRGHAKWFRLGKSTANFKRCLALGYPVVLGIALSAEMRRWQDSRGWIQQTACVMPLPAPGEHWRPAGHHCILLVGYDDQMHGGVFVARNSWGDDWGCGGHFYLPYGALSDSRRTPVAVDAMVVDV